jgi:SAM-dependent methyltransferase
MSYTAMIRTEDGRAAQTESSRRAPRTEPVGACPLCGTLEACVVFRAPDRLCGISGEFTYRRCAGCHTVFQDPKVIREDIAICYPESYYTHEIEGEVAGTDSGSGRFRTVRNLLRTAIKDAVQGRPSSSLLVSLGKVVSLSSRMRARAFNDLVDELIPRWPFGLRALEIGCGAGQLMVKLQSAGWEVEGVEYDPVAADIARKRSGCRVWEGDFVEIELATGQYHLVVLSHVFEHLEDPIEALRRIKDLLAPGGQAVLFYPNPRSAGARAFGDSWFHWDPPRHLVLPPVLSLAKAADRVGLRPVQWRTRTGTVSYFARTATASTAALPLSWRKASRTVAAFARLLTAFGFGVGEEAIIVLQRDRIRESQ